LGILIGAIRVGERGKQAYPKQLRSSTLIPRQEPGSLQAFQHGHQRDIQAFLVSKGWFFKHDRGTNRVVSNISPIILEKLEQQFFDEALTEEQQRKFGCMLMTVADIKSICKTPRSSCTDLESYLNKAASISELIRDFQDQLTDTGKSTYQYWQGVIRSLAEGQGKVDEMYRRKFVDGDSSTRLDPTQKYMSTKHDLAIKLGINSGNDYNRHDFNQAINELEDSGHISRKVGSWDENQKKRYLVLGALHARYLEKHGVPTIPSDPDDFVAFKSTEIEKLKLLKSNLHVSLHYFVNKVIKEISRNESNEVFTNFIQFGSLGNKNRTRQVLKRQVKDGCVMPMSEAITAPKNDSELDSVYKIQDVFDGPVNIDSQGPIYTYLYGLNRETNGASFSEFVNSVKQLLKNKITMDKDRYLKLFENREEEGLWLLSRFMQKGKVDDATAKEIFDDWTTNNCPKDRSDRLKTIFMIEAQNRLDYNRLCCLLGDDEIEVVRVLTEVPIRVGSGAAHYVVESASIPCLFKYLEYSNNKFKTLAAGALWNLAQDDDNRKAIGGEAGGIGKLIDCLGSDEVVLKINAAGALWCLALDDDNRKAIGGVAGGIGKLIECLGSDELVLKINAAGALWYLSLDADNRREIRVEGGIGKLIECLGSDELVLKINAASALWYLSLDADNRKSIGGVDGGIAKLIECLGSNNADLKRNAAGALLHLSWDAKNIKAIRKAGGIGKLIECLGSDDTELKRNAAGALWNLSWDAKNIKAIRKAGGISTLIKVARLWLF
jgi:hypothetical protein